MSEPRTALPSFVAKLVGDAALRYGIAPELARAVAWIESRGDQAAVGTSGELGVMQLMAATAEMLNVDRRSLADNIEGGVRYLAQHVKRYGVRPGVAAYNAGPGIARIDPAHWSPPVRAYVEKVLARSIIEGQQMGRRLAVVPLVDRSLAETVVRRRSSRPLPSSSSSASGKASKDDDT